MVLSPGTLPHPVTILLFAALPIAQAADSDPLPGTALLALLGNLLEQMHSPAERDIDGSITAAPSVIF